MGNDYYVTSEHGVNPDGSTRPTVPIAFPEWGKEEP